MIDELFSSVFLAILQIFITEVNVDLGSSWDQRWCVRHLEWQVF